MSKRKTEFINEEYYHVYNRGVDKRTVFMEDGDYIRFLKGLREFNDNSKYEQRAFLKKQGVKELSSQAWELSSFGSGDLVKQVEIVCYCLNPNHYHLILKQLADGGIKNFMHKLGTGYTNFFNTKYSRSGSLFQGPFKSIHIDNNEYFLYLSAYVNANHFIHYGKEKNSLVSWKYSSLSDYLGERNGTLCVKKAVLEQFKDAKEYEKFVMDNALGFREKKDLEKYSLE